MTREENDLLCRVEGDAPMGRIMRSHWIPACLSEELPEPDGAPVPVRLLGEDLVAWRTTDGAVGLIDRYCPHRRASLVYGRTENNGLRCLYHGWNLDVTGAVTDMPSERPGTAMLTHTRAQAYPTVEHGGIVWTYMGAPETMPPFQPPSFAPHPTTRVAIVKMRIACNWAQVLEGNIDSAHSSSLHSSEIRAGDVDRSGLAGGSIARPSTDKAPRIQVEDTPWGFRYAALRRPIKDPERDEYVRMTVFVAPFTVLIPPNRDYNLASVCVPIDDTHTNFYFMACGDEPGRGQDQDAWRTRCAAVPGVDLDADYTPRRTPANHYLQDRAAMQQGSFTGIRGVPNQDLAMWEGMGPIADRTREALGASDVAVAHFRRVMVEAARTAAQGGTARGCQVPRPEYAAIRSFEGVVPKTTDWRTLV